MQHIPNVIDIPDQKRVIQSQLLPHLFDGLIGSAIAQTRQHRIARRHRQDEKHHKGDADDDRDQHNDPFENEFVHSIASLLMLRHPLHQ